jgi:hypothetical protein
LQVSYADLFLYTALDADILRKFIPFSEEIKKHRAKVADLPNIADWLKKRPEAKF